MNQPVLFIHDNRMLAERAFYCCLLYTSYGNAQNFTVAYGEDESEYYYLTISWVPNAIIRELTDNEDSTIAALPEDVYKRQAQRRL